MSSKSTCIPKPSQTGAPAEETWAPFGAPVHEIVLALGLGGLIFVRPWVDGLTYPEKNTYFVGVVTVLFALWSARMLFRKEELRYPVHIGLLAVFFAVAFITGLFSVQYDATYRSLLNWAAYLMIFMMAASGLRSRSAVAIVLGFFVLTSFAETIWSILHIKYLMPMTREAVKDPALMERYFGTTEMTEAIRSRIESNRAMGSLLFANALACWVLVSIPFAIGGSVQALLKLRAGSPASVASEPRLNLKALILGLSIGFGAFVAMATYYSFYFAFAYPGDDWTNHPIRWSLYCAILPAGIGAGTYLAIVKKGTRTVLLWIQCGALAALALLQCIGLAHTYSRGGMLATAAALSLGGFLLWKGRKMAGARGAAIAALILFAAATGARLLDAPAWAVEGQPQPESQQPAESNLDLKGINPSFDAMMNPATAFLRLSYWRSALKMALANPITGVGLGNFGTVYPKYQLPNSADVKQAHNDFLQAFCETGVFGGIAFIAFWGYFALWGVRRVLREADTAYRWLLTGVFCGTLGFVLHAFVDFNFSNPALATLVFLLAGLFLSLAADSSVPRLTRGQAYFIGAPGLLAAAIVVACGWRVYQLDRTMGSKLEQKLRLEAAVDILGVDDTTSGAQAANPKFPQMSERVVSLLIPSRAAQETFGKLYTRLQPGSPSARPVNENESIPPDAILLIVRPQEAKARAMERIPLWLARFTDADMRYPYDPDVSAHLCLWYEMLFRFATTDEKKIEYATQCVEWARKCVERSPEQVAYRNLLARALWRRGEVDKSVDQLRYYDEAIKQYRKCIELYPSRPDVYFDFAKIAISYGNERKNSGDVKGGEALIEEGQAMQAAGERLQNARQKQAST